MLLFFLLCGRYLDHAMRRKTRAVAGNLAALKAEVAHRFEAGGEVVTVPLAALQARRPPAGAAGRAGAGRWRRALGSSEIDDSLVTGETARRKVAGRRDGLCRQLNYSGALTHARAPRPAGTLIDEVERLLEKARGARSRYLRLADRAARLYAPVVHATAALTALAAGCARRARARFDRHRDRRAHHHLSLRAGARGSGGAGGGLRRAVPLRRDSQRRRRHRAPGGGRHGRVRQDRNADVAGAAGGQRRRPRSGSAGTRPRVSRCRAAIPWRAAVAREARDRLPFEGAVEEPGQGVRRSSTGTKRGSAVPPSAASR